MSIQQVLYGQDTPIPILYKHELAL
jgi:hypothetical protein